MKTLAAKLATAETAQTQSHEQVSGAPSASRRDLLRYGAATLGAVAAAAATTGPPVEAANGAPLLIGSENTATTETALLSSSNGFRALSINNTGSAVTGISRAPEAGWGVLGQTHAKYGAGVLGEVAFGAADAVVGRSSSPSGSGVHGIHGGGIAVLADVPSGSSPNAMPLYARNESSHTGPTPGAGGFAVYGVSRWGHGVVGHSRAAGAAGIVGATNGVPGTAAGAFFGDVFVFGTLTVAGGAKSAAVPHPDGSSHRRLYGMESPESWFEDFGDAQLDGGRAEVTFDPGARCARRFLQLPRVPHRAGHASTRHREEPNGVWLHGRSRCRTGRAEGQVTIRAEWRVQLACRRQTQGYSWRATRHGDDPGRADTTGRAASANLDAGVAEIICRVGSLWRSAGCLTPRNGTLLNRLPRSLY